MDLQAGLVSVSTFSTQVNLIAFAMSLVFRFTELTWNRGPHK